MEFKIQRDTFLEGIQKTLGIVEKKTTMPILNNILIKAEDNKIKIVATDKEIVLIADYEAEIMVKGDITLSARKIYEMIREIQGEDIHFHANEHHWVTITCQKVIYKVPGLPADDFPSVFDDSDEVELFKIKGDVLKELIYKTSFAMSADEMRKNLNGVLFEARKEGESNKVRMVATDGHRLAMADVGMEGTFLELEKGIIIPRKGLSEIRKLIEAQSEDVLLGIRRGMCIVKTDGTVLKVSLIDADYPDYRRVMPAEKGVMVSFDRDTVLHALRRMNVISSERYSGVIMTLMEDKLVLNSTNPDVGEAKDEIEISYHEQEMTVGYNVKYLLDAIEVIDEERVILEIGQGMKPGVVKPVGNDHYKCIIMPLKI
ncbi:MAG: DNA polymerase III subunit beta [Deltaproteobacteria bacterium]